MRAAACCMILLFSMLITAEKKSGGYEGSVTNVYGGLETDTVITHQFFSGGRDLYRVYSNGELYGPYEDELRFLGYSADGKLSAWFAAEQLFVSGKIIGQYISLENLKWSQTGSSFAYCAEINAGSKFKPEFQFWVYCGSEKIGPYYNAPVFYYSGTALIVAGSKRKGEFVRIGSTDFGPFDSFSEPAYSSDGNHAALTAYNSNGETILSDSGKYGPFDGVSGLGYIKNASSPSFVAYAAGNYDVYLSGAKTGSYDEVRSFTLTPGKTEAAYVTLQGDTMQLVAGNKKYGPHNSIGKFSVLDGGEAAYFFQDDEGIKFYSRGKITGPFLAGEGVMHSLNGKVVCSAFHKDDNGELFVNSGAETTGPFKEQTFNFFIPSSDGVRMAWISDAWNSGGMILHWNNLQFGPVNNIIETAFSASGELGWIEKDNETMYAVNAFGKKYGPFSIAQQLVFSKEGNHFICSVTDNEDTYQLLYDGKLVEKFYDISEIMLSPDGKTVVFSGEKLDSDSSEVLHRRVLIGTESYIGDFIMVDGKHKGVIWYGSGKLNRKLF